MMLRKVITTFSVIGSRLSFSNVTNLFRRHSSTRAEILQHVENFLSMTMHQGRQSPCLFIGTGQYYEHKADDRVVVLTADFSGRNSQSFSVCEIIDTSMNASDIASLEQQISCLSDELEVYRGELDCVKNLPWNFGYSLHPKFCIFSKQDLISTISSTHSGKKANIDIFPGPKTICISDISHVQLRMSAEPWQKRYLELKLKSGEELELISDYRKEGSKDLCELMMTTEWLVKTAGQICVIARQQSDSHGTTSLRLPRELLGNFNQWVSLRNSLWAVESNK